MKNKIFYLFSLCCIVFCLQCNCHKDVDKPEDQLPPATQTGANTLGFLLNGQPWTPKGNSGGEQNLKWYYDPIYANGNLSISASRAFSSTD